MLYGEQKREYQRRWLQKRRNGYIEYLGGKCVVCETEDGLEFHHKVPEDKEFNIGRLLSRQREFVLKELDKCELRCEDCHSNIHTKYKTQEQRRAMWAAWKRHYYTPEARHEKYISTGW